MRFAATTDLPGGFSSSLLGLFARNIPTFRRLAGSRLSGWPVTWQGFNVMVELHQRTSIESVVRLVSELLDRTSV